MDMRYTKSEFVDKYEKGEKEYLKNFFKHIDRKTSSLQKNMDFFRFFGIERELIKETDSHYKIPFEAAELLAGLIRSYQCAYGTDRRGKRPGDRLAFSYEDHHKYIQALYQEMETMQPFQRELIRSNRTYRNAAITDRFLPMVTERIAMLLVVLFCYEPDQSSDDFIETISRLDNLIETIFNSRKETSERKDIPQQQEYTFEDAVSLAFRVLADDKFTLSASDSIQATAPKLISDIVKIRRKIPSKCSTDKVEMIREETRSKLNKAAAQAAKENLEFEKRLNDAASFYEDFWSTKPVSDRFIRGWLMETRHNGSIAVDMACGFGDYEGMGDDIGNILKKRAIEDINDGHLTALKYSVEDLEIYSTYHNSFPSFKTRIDTERAKGKEYVQIKEELIDELCKDVEKIEIQDMTKSNTGKSLYRYTQNTKNDPFFQKVQALINEAIAQLLPTHLQPPK